LSEDDREGLAELGILCTLWTFVQNIETPSEFSQATILWLWANDLIFCSVDIQLVVPKTRLGLHSQTKPIILKNPTNKTRY